MVTLGQQYNVGEKPSVILDTYINRHAEPSNTTNIRIIVPSNHTTIIGAWVNSKLSGRERPIVILYNYYYIDRHARTPNKTKTKNTISLNYNSLYYIASRNGWVSMKGVYK